MCIHRSYRLSLGLFIGLLTLGGGCGGGSGGGSGGGGSSTDTTPPTVRIDAPAAHNGTAFSATFTFDEAVNGFALTDIDLGAPATASASDLSPGSGSGSSFTVRIAPLDNRTDVRLGLAAGAVTDAAGNGNRAAADRGVRADATRPGVRIQGAPASHDGTAFAVTFTFDEPVTGLAQSDIRVTGGRLTQFDGRDADYRATVSPDVGRDIDITVPADVVRDAAGNGNRSATQRVVYRAVARLSGALTFDLVPHSASRDAARAGLDYANTRRRPIRGVVVEAVGPEDAAGRAPVLASSTSDAEGRYSLTVAADTPLRIRVKAHLLQTRPACRQQGGPRWDVQVKDNTNGNALYTLQGSLASSPTGLSTRDLHAASGWDAEKPAPANRSDNTPGGYRSDSARAAAPFAILSSVYDALEKLVGVDADMCLPALTYYWSVDNRSAFPTDLATGAIGSPFYDREGVIYLRGRENENSDEYDRHIVLHELAHHVQNHLSRDDSPGGGWGDDRLDMRLAFSEGFAIALGGIVTGDPVDRDSYGPRQAEGASRDMETNPVHSDSEPYRTGWYNADSVASVLYDLYDADDDGADRVSFGFAPIYAALASPGFKDNPLFTGIHSFVEQLRQQLPNRESAEPGLRALLHAQRIFGHSARGEGETNNGGIGVALPLYHTLSAAKPSTTVCSFGSALRGYVYNRLGNRVFVELDFAESDRYNLKMTKTSGTAGSKPMLLIDDPVKIRRGLVYEISEPVRVNTAVEESYSITAYFDFQAVRPLAIEVFDDRNVMELVTDKDDTSCFELSIVKA